MREAGLAGRGPGTAADDRRRRGAVVRCAKGRAATSGRSGEQPGDRVDPRHLERLVGVSAGRMPGSRRASIVFRFPAGQRAAGCAFPPRRSRARDEPAPAHARRRGRSGGRRRSVAALDLWRLALAAEVRDGLREMPRGDRLTPASAASAAASAGQRAGRARAPGSLGHGEDAADRSDPPVERELADRACSSSRSPGSGAKPREARARSGGRSPSLPSSARRARG